MLRFYAASFAICVAFPALATDVKVILNPELTQTSLSHTEVRQIFSARQQYWSDGTKITVYVLGSNTPTHQVFCREILRIFPYQLERLWNQIIYSGQGDRPVTVDSEAEMIDAVARTPGAVGYAYRGVIHSGVQEVAIQ
ncbi:hypothetical protein [Alteromonas sp. C1M14]|uniref:hypothetical protein n=1 Tax=Alteromonas sp. C1M14 TaxID=2841567 RepID=UPI001C07F1D0|nr:hypothetical protein [Alteromonas sp. C1M14]MBU2979845.1 hypothetical protein [Alteromonas sp. C1M14]